MWLSVMRQSPSEQPHTHSVGVCTDYDGTQITDGGGHGGAWLGAAGRVSRGLAVGVLKAEPIPQDLQDRTWDQRRENREPWRMQLVRQRPSLCGDGHLGT